MVSRSIKKHSFTLIELLITIGVMALLTALLIPGIDRSLSKNNLDNDVKMLEAKAQDTRLLAASNQQTDPTNAKVGYYALYFPGNKVYGSDSVPDTSNTCVERGGTNACGEGKIIIDGTTDNPLPEDIINPTDPNTPVNTQPDSDNQGVPVYTDDRCLFPGQDIQQLADCTVGESQACGTNGTQACIRSSTVTEPGIYKCPRPTSEPPESYMHWDWPAFDSMCFMLAPKYCTAWTTCSADREDNRNPALNSVDNKTLVQGVRSFVEGFTKPVASAEASDAYFYVERMTYPIDNSTGGCSFHNIIKNPSNTNCLISKVKYSRGVSLADDQTGKFVMYRTPTQRSLLLQQSSENKNLWSTAPEISIKTVQSDRKATVKINSLTTKLETTYDTN